MFSKYVMFVVIFVPISDCANILGIMPTPSYSHQIVYTPLWKELSLRGHNVTVITTNPMNDPKLVNLTEIDISFVYSYFANISREGENTLTMWNILEDLSEIGLIISEAVLSSPSVRELINNEKSFDVVLVESIFAGFLNFAKIYNCPAILISSFDVAAPLHRAVGNPSYTSLYPELNAPFLAPLNFKERIINTVYSWYISYCISYVFYPKSEKMFKRYFTSVVSTETLIRDVDMIFLNINPVIQTVRATGPSTINIGGYRETISAKPLPKDLEVFLDEATDGFIYFSLGSNMKSNELAGPTFTAIFEALKELALKVLWKFEDDNLPEKPDHIKIMKWVPQEKSMEEGIYRGVPFVVIPFFGDQIPNAKLMESKGIAKIVQRKPSVDKDELKHAILDVINNPRYKDSVKRLRRQALDTPLTGIESAVWWTEYVIRHKGGKTSQKSSC
ncbi:hypothetical protein NQ318_021870 [Aromia moschata]|uniref:Uncharacterized protein n=1 Tax=Aromia moschata TaxID=1265417 RepID=A0AAV8Z6Y4_9CUCU|nr:hypothetical protein NQ318_021870 [Aromia moschata]